MAIDYDDIKQMSKDEGRPMKTLIALAPCNDPFYAGCPGPKAQAEWFADLYERFMSGVARFHIRRIHYVLVSQPSGTVLNLKGEPYENVDSDYNDLGNASQYARYLHLVPIEDFEDRRNPDPVITLPDVPDEPETSTTCGKPILLETLPVPVIGVEALCVVCEKTTVSDVLDALAEEYGLNVTYGMGELSISACRDLIDRVEANGNRPCRILDVSDFDPAGHGMPVAVARKIEWFMRENDLDYDIQVRPVILTKDQCIHYRLPRTPNAENDRRAARFEARFGEGRTELDALEALYPGELRNILVKEIERYLDPGFKADWDGVVEDVESELNEVSDSVRETFADELAPFEERYQKIRADLDALLADVQPVYRRMRVALNEEGEAILDNADFPEPPDFEEDPDPLYDSSREYLEQIDRYKEHQGKTTEYKVRSNRRHIDTPDGRMTVNEATSKYGISSKTIRTAIHRNTLDALFKGGRTSEGATRAWVSSYDVTCEICGKPFTSKIVRAGPRFCSAACRQTNQRRKKK